MDTQRLLLGVDISEVDRFSLEEILAEFGGGAEAPEAETPAADPLPEEPEVPVETAPEAPAPRGGGVRGRGGVPLRGGAAGPGVLG